jgi:hypothetical protein
MLATLIIAGSVLGYAPAGSRVLVHSRVAARSSAVVHMDETLLENVFDDSLETEGAEKPWMSESGWALYLVRV